MSGASIGFFGKLPSHGDFIERRIGAAFREAWDEWLQRCIAESQRSLGGRWLDYYLESPMWRFFLSDGVAGAGAHAGVLVPSVDRVGRYFPFTVVIALPTVVAPLALARAGANWFVKIEQLCADALQARDFELAAFDAALEASSAQLLESELYSAAETFHGSVHQWRWPVRSSADMDAAFGAALIVTAQNALRPMTMWWTDGSEHVQPSALLCRGLVRPESFASLLAGTWEDGHWHGDLAPVASPPPEDIPADVHYFTESAAATDAGTVRAQNQDNFALNDANRLWAVADGMGGHRDGDVASQMVVDSLNSVQPTASLDASIEAVDVALQRVNADLRRAARGDANSATSGSTVVVLLIRAARFAVCWAGDSRAYLYRGGALTQLTRDHADAPRATGEASGSLLALVGVPGEITRAVGGDDTLELDQIADLLMPGDRFLLCTDGLYVALDQNAIVTSLELPSAAEACAGLIAQARAAGADDNVTAVIVDVKTAA